MSKALRIFFRILLGLIFIASGLMKLSDPIGLEWRMQEILLWLDLDFFYDIILYPAIIFGIIELIVGVNLLLKAAIKTSSVFALVLSGFIVIANAGYYFAGISYQEIDPVFNLWDIDTLRALLVSVGIFLFAIVVFLGRKSITTVWSRKGAFFLSVLLTSAGIFWVIYSSFHLPPFSYGKWKIGTQTGNLVIPIPEISEPCFVYKNNETGVTDTILIKDFTSSGVWKDSIWIMNHEFIDRDKQVTREYVEAPIPGFLIQNVFNDDKTADILLNPEPNFLVVSYNVEEASISGFRKINEFAREAEMYGVATQGITSTLFQPIDYFRHENQIVFEIYHVGNPLMLKEMVHANPGVILLKAGRIIKKWHYYELPPFTKVKETYLNN
ncbi:MAG: DoxX family membrane protein [Bacteroidetes bacterium]|nr:DoxX family membrane protein [Bacteroidota bacterium]MBU1719691.1 DoxX family membrane protein [Bacteroidota bacterium]